MLLCGNEKENASTNAFLICHHTHERRFSCTVRAQKSVSRPVRDLKRYIVKRLELSLLAVKHYRNIIYALSMRISCFWRIDQLISSLLG